MSATQIPLTFRLAPLPTGFVGNPQQLASAIVARLTAVSANTLSFFASGSVAPTSNVGPWLKNDQTWYVWSDALATYIPEVIEPQSLGYTFSQAAPDQTVFKVWYKLDGASNPIGIFIYANGSWQDVYASQFANYFTSAQTTAAITAAVAASQNYPVIVSQTSSQTIPVDALTNTRILLNSVSSDVDSVYNSSNSQYVAKANGLYQVDVTIQIDNGTAVASSIEFSTRIVRNGAGSAWTVGTSVPNPPGLRWYVPISALVSMNENDTLEVDIFAQDGTNTGNVMVSNSFWAVYLVRRT